MSGYSDHICL